MKKQNKIYVSMTDKFLSGWGPSRGLINKFVVECDDIHQARKIESNGERRKDMKHVNIRMKKPYYSPSRYLTTNIKYSDLGGAWVC